MKTFRVLGGWKFAKSPKNGDSAHFHRTTTTGVYTDISNESDILTFLSGANTFWFAHGYFAALDEIQELFSCFAKGTSVPGRWKQLSARKLQELAAQMSQIQFMQGLLQEMMANWPVRYPRNLWKGPIS